ncbi:MAG: TPM domain-containing protein [Deltaproteobacteria bacterium]|nr:TPM domain-containing protein [Deltaproteobacteria bacterium]
MVFSLLLALAFSATKVEVPYLSGALVDEVGLLSARESAQVTHALEALNATRKAQMAVLIAKSLQGVEIEPFSIAVTDQWKLGGKKSDNGILFVIAPNERKMRFEIGYGLEGDLTDAFSRRLLDNAVRPLFKERRYGDGITAAVALVGEKLGQNLPGVAKPKPDWIPQAIVFGSLGLFFLFFIMIVRQSARQRGSHWQSGGGFSGGGGWRSSSSGWGGSSGGGFGGGGGGFGGGGSSGSW